MPKFITLGEIMLRLKTPGHDRFFQNPSFEATFGGGEANVAVSLANYGFDAGFVTALPNNDIAEACIRETLEPSPIELARSGVPVAGVGEAHERLRPRPAHRRVPQESEESLPRLEVGSPRE